MSQSEAPLKACGVQMPLIHEEELALLDNPENYDTTVVFEIIENMRRGWIEV
jgi:hypothetical protein